jgi:hypothetical protein
MFKNIVMVRFMSEAKAQSAAFSVQSEFLCWRGRECEELYSCQVSRQENRYVNLNLDIMPIRLAKAVAEDIARCIYDAVFITVGNIAGFVPTPAHRESILQRMYRKRVSGEWSYCAEGRFNFYETEDEIYVVDLAGDGCDEIEKVAVYTVEGGGVELVFDFMVYSFSMHDAVWLSNALMEAVGREPLDTLETTSKSCRPMAGFYPAELCLNGR